ncbi:AIPR protein [Picosynechococcus sp. OG1]|nr:AIPR protein [Picosynechococcus sp. OG1]SMQ83542.1 AIPR protein [Synechococcus sp. 7002]
MDVQNIVCDGSGDKGIDGIYINHNEEIIDIFQAKIVKTPTKTLGDSQLKEFIGSLRQVKNDIDLEKFIKNTHNVQLKGLLENNKEYFLSPDFTVRGVFITNINKDHNAKLLLDTFSNSDLSLVVWDKDLIVENYTSSEKAIPKTQQLSFDVYGFDHAEFYVKNSVKIVIAPLSAIDLVKMEGIENQQIFELNLRKSLGSNKTKVNKDISNSIKDSSEHINFLLYHNGITIICESVDTSEKDKIKIKNYSIVNGCQSVSCLYKNKESITEDLRILARLIQVPSESDLISKITYNSNNQNGIRARDFRSNTPTQVRLQQEINTNFSDFVYQIKTGETKKAQVDDNQKIIDNTLAGQLMLAFDLKLPSRVQRPGRIFDDWHQEIFSRPEVNGARIVALFKIFNIVSNSLSQVNPSIFAGYQITKFFLLYLLRQVLELDEEGKEFCKHPEDFFSSSTQERKMEFAISRIISDLIIDLNAEFEERGGQDYDFKSVFKKTDKINDLSKSILSSYKKMLSRKRIETFSELIENSSQ